MVILRRILAGAVLEFQPNDEGDAAVDVLLALTCQFGAVVQNVVSPFRLPSCRAHAAGRLHQTWAMWSVSGTAKRILWRSAAAICWRIQSGCGMDHSKGGIVQ